jgi:hypothetical protein
MLLAEFLKLFSIELKNTRYHIFAQHTTFLVAEIAYFSGNKVVAFATVKKLVNVWPSFLVAPMSTNPFEMRNKLFPTTAEKRIVFS